MAPPIIPCQTLTMTKSGSMSGGFFIFVAIIVGFVWGVANGQAMRGVLFGTIGGIAIAVLVWLYDRWRGR